MPLNNSERQGFSFFAANLWCKADQKCASTDTVNNLPGNRPLLVCHSQIKAKLQ